MPLPSSLPPDIFVRAPPRLRAAPTLRRDRPSDGASFRPGTIIDKYRIEEFLGSGGFGAVYRATHLMLRMAVALKHLRRVDDDERMVRELVQEARCAARIQHPSVVRVYDVTHLPNLSYIVMEYIDGETLAQTLAGRGRLPAEDVVRIGVELCGGLEAARREGLVHRDIKPANILLAKGGRACIVDLGLAHRAGGSPAGGGFVGTRGYAAPEQGSPGGIVDYRADIYGLGTTLHEALTGKKGDPVPADAPEPLVALLARMTAATPDARPQSFAEIAAALTKAV